MIEERHINTLKSNLDAASQVLIIFGPEANLDVRAASCGLFVALEQTEKDVLLASPEQPNPHPQLAALNQLKTDINNRNLVVSFDYKREAVEKVNYHIGQETNRFYLTVEPKPGHRPLDKSTVQLDYAGAEADLIFLIGVHDYESLDQLYTGNERLFADTTVVTIHNFAPEIGDLKLTSEDELNLSSVVTELAKSLELTLPADAATSLLFSLETATDHFASLSTTPKVLEQAAWLMRQGARRVKAQKKALKTENKAKKAAIKVSAKSDQKPVNKTADGLDHQPNVYKPKV